MKRVLLLLPTSTYSAAPFVDAARALRVAVVVGTDERQAFGERTHTAITLDYADPVPRAVEFAREYPIDAVVATDDDTSVVAARIAAALRLPHNTVEAARASRDKLARRQALRDAGLRSPAFAMDAPVGYPCVLKPTCLAASRGVIRADDDAGFAAAHERIRALLRELGKPEQVLVESFIPGREVALEGLLADGRLRVLAVFDKPDPLDGPYFEETIYVTPSRLPTEPLANEVERACAALGLSAGPIHAELRVNEAGPWILEVAARQIGGRCSRALRFGAGVSLEELILRHAVGMQIDFPRESAAAGVMMIPVPRRGVLREVRGKGPNTEITIAVGQEVVPLPEGNRYLGFIFARGETPEAVTAALRAEHAQLELQIEPQSR